MSNPIIMEYRLYKLIARQLAIGWTVEIFPPGSATGVTTMAYPGLSEAIDEAQNVVDASH